MIKLSDKDADHISFPDFDIISTEFCPNRRYLKIYLNGAWFGDNKKGKMLENGYLLFQDWKEFEMRQFRFQSEEWISCVSFEPLHDICEFVRVDANFFVRGFGLQSGLWIEYRIQAPSMEGEFEEKNL